MTLALQPDRIFLRGMQRAPFAWGDTGTTAMANGSHGLHVLSLSADGLREADFDLGNEVAAEPAAGCLAPAAQ
jgi:hypothetical protein